jgi:transposase/integrase
MTQNFIECDREQAYLMPPSLRDWVAEDHLVWTVLQAVKEMDLDAFYCAYRADGHGRPAYDPAMMVALLLYPYARGNRSSRGIERECQEDVVYRIIAANRVPDHSTIAEFRVRHETALAGLFGEVLHLCKGAGLVSVGMIAVDGTKVHANASRFSSLDYQQMARKILEEADRVDREEDELYGEARGDELPEQLRTVEGRREALRAAKRRLEQRAESEELISEPSSINKTIATLATILEVAVDYDLIERNPAHGRRRRLRGSTPKRPWLDRADHIVALLDGTRDLDEKARAARGQRRALLATLVFAGLRLGETLALRWRDLDLVRGTIVVSAAKTDAGMRGVNILPILHDELTRYRSQLTISDESLVFGTGTGRPHGATNVRRRVLAKSIERANAALEKKSAEPLPRGLTPHALRRTFASLLFAMGETPLTGPRSSVHLL